MIAVGIRAGGKEITFNYPVASAGFARLKFASFLRALRWFARIHRGIAATLLRVAWLPAVAMGAMPAVALAEHASGVLIIHSNQRVTPAAVIIENTLRKIVPEAFQRPVEFFSEYLDIEWATTEDAASAQAEFLRQKYRDRNVRIIVASAPQALQFTIRFRGRILPGVPVVHVAVATDQLGGSLPIDVVGRTVDLDPSQTLALALGLHPEAAKLVIVLGAAERDRAYERRLRTALAQIKRPIEVEFLSGLPTADVVRELAALRPPTIVYTPGYFVDGAGAVSTPRQTAERIVPASGAPVYAPLDTLLGTGIVGGYMATFEEQAAQAGAIVVRLLKGDPASSIGTSSIVNAPIVDWRALRRWDVDQRLLPSETIVRFRELTLWDLHWREISAAVAMVLLQAGLITALLLERRSRRRVAGALESSQKRIDLAARAARLSMWEWDRVRDRFWTTAPPPRSAAPRSPRRLDQLLDRVHDVDRDNLRRAVEKAAAGHGELDIEFRTMEPSGDVRWIAARGRVEAADDHRLVGVTQDITARKTAELSAERDRAALTHIARVSMVGQLSASIAHQLNQPLAAILGNAEAARKLLDRQTVDLAELREICDDIVAEDNRAADVIRRLGALYKRGELKLAPLDLNTLVRDTVDLLRAEMVSRHVAIVTELAESQPVIEGGRIQLQQVLLNLVLNAADAMGGIPQNDRMIVVRTHVAGVEAHMRVIDRGPGIPPQDLPRIFDPFWSTKPGGMGIGLAICQSIVGAHRGKLTAANNPDRGATFCVLLPVGEPATIAERPSDVSAENPPSP